MKVYFVRHGETDYAALEARGVKGWARSFAPLSALGRVQIDTIAQDYRLEEAEAILCSSYARALESAARLSRALNKPLYVEYDLHEWLPQKDSLSDIDSDTLGKAQAALRYYTGYNYYRDHQHHFSKSDGQLRDSQQQSNQKQGNQKQGSRQVNSSQVNSSQADSGSTHLQDMMYAPELDEAIPPEARIVPPATERTWESLEEVQGRVIQALKRYSHLASVVVVSHAVVMASFLGVQRQINHAEIVGVDLDLHRDAVTPLQPAAFDPSQRTL